MMRRTLPCHDRLVLVESPNKCAKITQILQANVKDWTFGLPHLKAAAATGAAGSNRELVAVKPTIGHFMTVQDLEIRRAPFDFTPVDSNSTKKASSPGDEGEEAGGKGSSAKKGGAKKKGAAAAAGGSKKAVAAAEAAALLELPPLPANSPLLTFVPHYELSKDNRSMTDVLQYIQANRAHINEIILAPDPDREGELIAVHALRFLQKKLNTKGTTPILFSRAYIQAITEEGVVAAMKKRQLNYCDFSLAEAASARHSMDRIFGWVGSTTMRGVDPSFISIGRVQTPALVLVRGQELKAEKVQKEHKASFVVQGKINIMATPPKDTADTTADAEGTTFTTVLSKNVTFTLVSPTSGVSTTLGGDSENSDGGGGAAGGSSFASMDEAKAWLNSFEGKGADIDKKDGATVTPQPPLVATLIKPPTTSRNKQSAPPPFTMQALLTAANAQLRIGTEGVTAALQDLFQAGLITYPRTDSTRIDDSFIIEKLQPFIEKEFGKEMFVNRQKEEEAPTKAKKGDADADDTAKKAPAKKKKKGEENIEDAHEALRPTSMSKHPAAPELIAVFHAGAGGNSNIRSAHAYPIYKMIFRATVGAFMTQSESENVAVSIGLKPASSPPGGAMLLAKLGASRVIAPGWKAAKRLEATGSSAAAAAAARASDAEAAAEAGEEEEEEIDPSKLSTFDILKNVVSIPSSTKGDGTTSLISRVSLPGGGKKAPAIELPLSVVVEDLKASEKALVLPKMFTEGTLIQELKNHGVGRPSTYASILKTLFSRKYIYSDTQGRLHTTDVGQGVVNAAQNVFPALVDINFTAKFEEELDSISTFRGGGVSTEDDTTSASKKKNAAAKKNSTAAAPTEDGQQPNRDLGEGNNPLSCYTLSRFTYALKGMVQQALLRSKLITYYRRELVRGIGSAPVAPGSAAAPRPSLTASVFEGCDALRPRSLSTTESEKTNKNKSDVFTIAPGTTLSSNTPHGALMRKVVILKTAPEIPLVAEIDRREQNRQKSAAEVKVKPTAAATVAAAKAHATTSSKFTNNNNSSPFDPNRFTLNALSFTIKGVLTREGGLGTMKTNAADMVPGRLFRSEEDMAVLLDTTFPPVEDVIVKTANNTTAPTSATQTAATMVKIPPKVHASTPPPITPSTTKVAPLEIKKAIPTATAAPTPSPSTSPVAPTTAPTPLATTPARYTVEEPKKGTSLTFGSFGSQPGKQSMPPIVNPAQQKQKSQATDAPATAQREEAPKDEVVPVAEKPSSPPATTTTVTIPIATEPKKEVVVEEKPKPPPFDPWGMMGRRF